MRLLIYGLFLLSGACALVYQVAWVRVLSVAFGTTTYAISTVLTVFMAGLALGGYAFGRLADRRLDPLRLYAAVEIGLGAYAAAFALLAPAGIPLAWRVLARQQQAWLSDVSMFLLALAVLIVPTTLMGATLPILSKAVTESLPVAGARLARLHGVNTFGALIGCLVAAFWMILRLGVTGSILAAAAVNVSLGVLAALLSVRRRVGSPAPRAELIGDPPPTADGTSPPVGRAVLYVVAFGSGFCVLAAEVLWTRLMVNFFSGNVQIFATVLAGFLAGLAAASLAAAYWVDRLKRFDLVLGWLLLTSSAWLAASVFGQLPLGRLFDAVQSSSSLDHRTATFAALILLLLVVAIPVLNLGLVFPVLLRIASRSLGTLAGDVGRLYAVNTLGAIAGAFAGGFVLLAFAGLNAGLLLLAGLYAGLAFRLFPRPALKACGLAAAAAWLGLSAVPSVRRPVYWYNGGFEQVATVPRKQTVFLEEGVEGTVGVARWNADLSLTVNGVVVAESTPADLWDLQMKAHLPMLLHPAPRRIALVGLGAGVSLGAVESYEEPERIDCIELSPSVTRACRHFAYWNLNCLRDERLQLHVDDGRHFLATTARRYDVISVDPVDPPVCSLYTQDFFQVCHDRLDRGGIMVQWTPLFHLRPDQLRVVVRAFQNVFPEATLWYDGTSILLIGCRDAALQADFAQMQRRILQPRVAENLSRVGRPGVPLILSMALMGPASLRRMADERTPRNTDDFPFMEYTALWRGRPGRGDMADNLAMLAPMIEPLQDFLPLVNASDDDVARISETRRVVCGALEARIPSLRGDWELGWDMAIRVAERHDLSRMDLEALSPFFEGVGQ